MKSNSFLHICRSLPLFAKSLYEEDSERNRDIVLTFLSNLFVVMPTLNVVALLCNVLYKCRYILDIVIVLQVLRDILLW